MLRSSVTKREAFGGGVNVDVGVLGMMSAVREQLRTAALLCVARSVSRATCPQLLRSGVTEREAFGGDFTVDGEVFGSDGRWAGAAEDSGSTMGCSVSQ